MVDHQCYVITHRLNAFVLSRKLETACICISGKNVTQQALQNIPCYIPLDSSLGYPRLNLLVINTIENN